MKAPGDFQPVTRREPCVICGKGDWCRRTADGAHECHRINEPAVNGYERVAKTPSGFAVYRRPEDRKSPSGRTSTGNAKRPRIFDSPEAAAKSFARWKNGTVERVYRWSSSWCRARIRLPDGKTFCEITLSGTGWVLRGPPKPHPLYRVGELPPDGIIVVCEGEKPCDAGWSIGLPCVTSGAADSARSADWTGLAGREVAIFPDRDPAGARYADEVARQLTSLNRTASVKIVELPGLDEAEDLHDFINEHRDSREADEIKEEIMALIASTPEYEEYETPPEPLQWEPFPTHVLPQPLRDFVTEGAAALGCDPSMIALPVLASCASAIGTTRRARLKRSWSEPSVIWAAVVARSGTLKSPALELAIRPLHRIQAERFREHEGARAEYERSCELYEAERTDWKRKRKDRGDPPEKPETPICTRYIVSDTTVEALTPILHNNPRGVLLARDELSGWILGFNQYKASARGSDLANWLECHRAGTVVVDRKTSGTIYVPRSAVSIVGTIQPVVLQRSLTAEYFDSGLPARLLLASPPLHVKRWSNNDLSPASFARYEDVILKLLALEHGTDERGEQSPIDLALTTEALARWIEFYNDFAAE